MGIEGGEEEDAMKTATGLTLIAVGAILAFAITAEPPFFNFQIAGFVLMITGAAGMVIPRRGYGWLRRRMVLRRDRYGRLIRRETSEEQLPPYIAINPAADDTRDDLSAVRTGADTGDRIPSEETVDEFREE
jgi:hypothetical protein